MSISAAFRLCRAVLTVIALSALSACVCLDSSSISNSSSAPAPLFFSSVSGQLIKGERVEFTYRRQNVGTFTCGTQSVPFTCFIGGWTINVLPNQIEWKCTNSPSSTGGSTCTGTYNGFPAGPEGGNFVNYFLVIIPPIERTNFTSANLTTSRGITAQPPSGGPPQVTLDQRDITVRANLLYLQIRGLNLRLNATGAVNYTTIGAPVSSSSSSTGISSSSSSSSSSTGVSSSSSSSSTAAQLQVSSSSSTGASATGSTGGNQGPSTGGEQQPGNGGANGDPQISGFLGQSFQVHGTANTVYSVISSAKLQYNALFSFLSKGKCRAGTECFAHPGNYFGAVGMLLKQEDGKVVKLQVTAGPVDEGMKVTIDGESLMPTDKHLTIDSVNSLHFGSVFELLLQTRDYTLRLQNSDMFLNQQVSIRAPLLAQIQSFKSKSATNVSELPHGILGQTWRRMSYPNRWVHLEGDLMNYIVADGLMALPSEMNRFESQA